MSTVFLNHAISMQHRIISSILILDILGPTLPFFIGNFSEFIISL